MAVLGQTLQTTDSQYSDPSVNTQDFVASSIEHFASPKGSSAGGSLPGLNGMTLKKISAAVGNSTYLHCNPSGGPPIPEPYPPIPGWEPDGQLCKFVQSQNLGKGIIKTLKDQFAGRIPPFNSGPLPGETTGSPGGNPKPTCPSGKHAEASGRCVDDPKPTPAPPVINPTDPLLSIFDKIFAVGFTGGPVSQAPPDAGFQINNPVPVNVGGVSATSIIILIGGLIAAYYLYKRYS